MRFFAMMAVMAVMAVTSSCGSSDKALDMAVTEINKQLEVRRCPASRR